MPLGEGEEKVTSDSAELSGSAREKQRREEYTRVREKIIKIKTTSAEAAAATTTTETNQQGKVTAESATLPAPIRG